MGDVVEPSSKKRKKTECPFLDTINRQVLDFDFEKVCSISLSTQNVYCCLVCGKYFQGRGKQTYASTHSTMSGHHMFLNLETCKVYCLPENYEVIDSSLDDVVACLRPEYETEDLQKLDETTALARDVHGVAYLPGFCGLNNLKHTDYISVVVHALGHVKPLRDFFLRPSNYAYCVDPLVVKFGELLRKIWSKHNFKSVVSPHEFTQVVVARSSFEIGKRADAVDFLAWFLNALHLALSSSEEEEELPSSSSSSQGKKKTPSSQGKKKRKGSKIIHDVFRGFVKVETYTRRTGSDAGEAESDAALFADPGAYGWQKTAKIVPFLYLTLDIPPTPLFKDSMGGNVIPQIPLFDVLAKYDGVTLTDSVKAGTQSRRRYVIQSLPKYLIFHLARFSKNNFTSTEKNPTVVNFPAKNLQLKDQFAFDDDDDQSGTIHTKKKKKKTPFPTKFDLLANVCHDVPPGVGKEDQQDPLQNGTYRVHVKHPATDQWYEIQDLHVSETMPQLIGLSESLMMIYKATDTTP